MARSIATSSCVLLALSILFGCGDKPSPPAPAPAPAPTPAPTPSGPPPAPVVEPPVSQAPGTWERVMKQSSLQAMDFLDARRGLVTGMEGTRVTEDGGNNWRAIGGFSRSGAFAMLMRDRRVWYRVGRGIQVSEDAGATVRTLKFGPGPTFGDLVFFDATTAVTVRGGALLRTTDAGRSWTTVLEQSRTRRLCRVDRTTAIAVGGYTGGGRAGGTFSEGEQWRTTDAGASWQQTRAILRKELLSASFPTAKVGFAVAIGGTLLRTGDGGDSWGACKTGAPVNACAFVDARTGYAVGPQGAILTTSDGGASWVPEPIAGRPADEELLDVRCPSPGVVYVLGRAGVLRKVLPGG